MLTILTYFHHIHHYESEHEVHHCGGKHKEPNYNINHCSCGKHKINKPKAIGHDFDNNEVLVIFTEECPDGGWHIESGYARSSHNTENAHQIAKARILFTMILG